VRIAFATTTADVLQHDQDLDRVRHEAAFAEAGVDLDYRVWWDPDVPWEDYELVVIRSTWDYVERLDEFRRWLRRVGGSGLLRNPGPVVEWNLDKRYLLELQAVGLPVIATQIVTNDVEISTALGSVGGEVVVKPVVSAGSRDTGRFDGDDPRARALAEKILDRGMAAMVQPCVASVATTGEIGAVLFNGTISHAFRKNAILALGGGYRDGAYVEEVSSQSLTGEQQRLVEETSDAVARVVSERYGVVSPLLYARVDLVTLDDGRDVVLEVELAEPTFFLSVDSQAAGRFVHAVMKQVTMA